MSIGTAVRNWTPFILLICVLASGAQAQDPSDETLTREEAALQLAAEEAAAADRDPVRRSIPRSATVLLSEDFAAESFPPAGWTHYKLQGGGSVQWVRSTAQSNTPPASAFRSYSNPADGHQDDWLVTPSISIPNANFFLAFADRGGFMAWYTYSGVWASTGSCDPTDNDFVELAEVDDSTTNWRLAPAVSLSSFSGEDVCLAFRYSGEDGHSWWIDDVVVTDAAELLSETFADESFPPAGWTTYRLQGGGVHEWERVISNYNSSPASAHRRYSVAGDGHQDDWLVTPSISIPNANFFLSFADRGQWMDDYGYSGVWASTGSCDPATDDFVELVEIDDSLNNAWRLVPDVSLAAFEGQTVCLAFRYSGLFAHSWWIDDVVVNADPSANEPSIAVSPTSITITEPGAQAWTPSEGQLDILRDGPLPDHVPGRLLVKFESGVEINARTATTGIAQVDELGRQLGLDNMRPLVRSTPNTAARHQDAGFDRIYVLEFSAARDVRDLVEAYRAMPGVESADPDYLAHITLADPPGVGRSAPNDPMYHLQWGLNNTGQALPYGGGGSVGTPGADINAEEAWTITTGSSNITVAILDTGVNTHSEFAGRMVPGYNFATDNNDTSDVHGHGTAVAGIAAAAGNNGAGVAGVAWDVNIMPMRVCNANGSCPTSAWIGAIIWATDEGADVINLSLGGSGFFDPANDAVNYAHSAGVVVFASTGNHNASTPNYPAAYPNSISVGALSPCNDRKTPTTCDGEDWWGSGFASGMDFLAPGTRIHTTHMSGDYTATFNGTSAASPFAAGVGALILSANPSLTPDEVRSIMQSTAVDLGTPGYNDDTGYGRLDAGAALQVIAGSGIFTVANIGGGSLDVSSIITDQTWLTVDPTGPFSLTHGESQSVEVIVDWGQVSQESTGTITVSSNDSMQPSVTVSVTAIPVEDENPPEAEVSPASLAFELGTDQTDSAVLTLSNIAAAGASDLEFTVSVNALGGRSVPATLSPAAHVAAREPASPSGHFVTDYSQYLVDAGASRSSDGLPGINALGLRGIDCDNAEGIIIQDDGTRENGYSGTSVDFITLVDKFTPSGYPATFTDVCIAFYTSGPTTMDFEVVFYADDGPGGTPGTSLGSFAATAMDIPDIPESIVWQTVDVSAAGVEISSGSVYIGALWAPPSPNVWLQADESDDGRPAGYAGGQFRIGASDAGGSWNPIVSTIPAYRALFIRPVAAIAAEDLMVTVSPTSGSVGAGLSQGLVVSVNTEDIDAGTYDFEILISTNDPDNAQLEVPVAVTVTDESCDLTWSVDFVATSETAVTSNLALGQGPDASDGLDPACGELELPPPPPGFEARFILPDGSTGSYLDFRHDDAVEPEWSLSLTATSDDFPVEFTWDPSSFPADRSFFLQDAVTGGDLVSVDLTTQSSFTHTNSGITSLVIVEGDPCPLTWSTDLVATSATSTSSSLSFGQGPEATDGLDPACGELELPPPPPAFEARFILPDGSTGSYVDYRNDDAQDPEWDLSLTATSGEFPVEFVWDPATLPADRTFFLRDAVTGGTIVNVDMSVQGSFTHTETGVTSLEIVEGTGEMTVPVPLIGGWNVLSVPVTASDMSTAALFPSATSNFFKFEAGYVTADPLETGVGYWAKFDDPETVDITGLVVSPQEVTVSEGWNIIGFFEQPVQVSALTSDPDGLVDSHFFGYDAGYSQATTLEVGRGYWVKSSGDGILYVDTQGRATDRPIADAGAAERPFAEETSLTLVDALGRTATLHLLGEDVPESAIVLPPVPPEGAFDVRFAGDRSAGVLHEGFWDLLIAGAEFPIRLIASDLDGVLHLSDGIDGSLLDIELENGAEVTIAEPLASIKVLHHGGDASLPDDYALEAAYPNPTTGSATIGFALPEEQHVRLVVYDVLGRMVTTLLDGDVAAGRHEVVLPAGGLASGTYIYRLEAGAFVETRRLTITR